MSKRQASLLEFTKKKAKSTVRVQDWFQISDTVENGPESNNCETLHIASTETVPSIKVSNVVSLNDSTDVRI